MINNLKTANQIERQLCKLNLSCDDISQQTGIPTSVLTMTVNEMIDSFSDDQLVDMLRIIITQVNQQDTGDRRKKLDIRHLVVNALSDGWQAVSQINNWIDEDITHGCIYDHLRQLALDGIAEQSTMAAQGIRQRNSLVFRLSGAAS